MDLSRIESGSGLTVVDDLDLGKLAAASVERLRLFADRQGVKLRTDVPRHLPRIRGDEARLGQVFVNLVHNAVKFSPGGGEVVVTVRKREAELLVVDARRHRRVAVDVDVGGDTDQHTKRTAGLTAQVRDVHRRVDDDAPDADHRRVPKVVE